MKLSVVDLFSGSGGMSCGFARNESFELLGAADIEVAKPSHGIGSTSCNATYAANHGLRPASVNLSEVGPSDIASHFGFSRSDVDVLISCAPCTGFSQKQARNHIEDDPRNKLVERTALFAAEWRPRYILIENVKELLKGRHRHHFQALQKELTDLGYYVSAEVHDLARYGLPQSRIRSLVVAKLHGELHIDLPPAERVRTVRDTIAHLPPLAAGETDALDPMHACPSMRGVSLDRMRAIPKDGGSWIDIPDDKAHLRIPSMDLNSPGSFPDIYGRLAWNKPAPTITRECSHPGNGRYCHPDQDRLLSVREMSLLQGFPPDYVFLGNLSSRYRQIGDSVPPFISRLLASAIASDASGEVSLPVGRRGQLRLAV